MDEEYYNMKASPQEHSHKPLYIRPGGQRVWCCPHCMEKHKTTTLNADNSITVHTPKPYTVYNHSYRTKKEWEETRTNLDKSVLYLRKILLALEITDEEAREKDYTLNILTLQDLERRSHTSEQRVLIAAADWW